MKINKEYTPGPWRVGDEVNPTLHTVFGTGEAADAICFTNELVIDVPVRKTGQPTRKANARLISAAPQLVDAAEKSLCILLDYLERMENGDCDPELLKEIREAVLSNRAALTKAGVLKTER